MSKSSVVHLIKKTAIAAVIAAVALSLVFCVLKITAVIEYNRLSESEIQLSEDETAQFVEHFEIQPPEYLHILNCTSGSEGEWTWFGVKAAISKEDAELLARYLEDEDNFSIMSVHRHDTCVGNSYQIDHRFAQNVEWWNLDIERQVAHFALTNHDETMYRYSAIVIEKTLGGYYVYLWHESPATVYI